MPPLPKLRVAALDELARQLRFAPAEAARRHLTNAEALVEQLAPAQEYPADWIVFRVTGYRPEMRAPELVGGEQLIADMGALIERLSEFALLTERELRGQTEPREPADDGPSLSHTNGAHAADAHGHGHSEFSASARVPSPSSDPAPRSSSAPAASPAPPPSRFVPGDERAAEVGEGVPHAAEGVPGARCGVSWLTIEELMLRWNVSRKTVERYRRLGLVARRVRGSTGKPRLLFSAELVERFEGRYMSMVRGAGEFSRIPPEVAQEMIRRARRYRESLGWSLNSTAKRLAQRFGRGHETVRQVLLRHEREAQLASAERPGLRPHAGAHGASSAHAVPLGPGKDAGETRENGVIFGHTGPITARQKRFLERCERRAIDPLSAAERVRKSGGAARRALLEAHAEALRGLDLRGPTAAGFEAAGSSAVYLEHPSVTTGLGLSWASNLSELVAEAARIGVVPAGDESAQCAAYCFLRWRASRSIRSLARYTPSLAAIDRVRTDLIWASRLKTQIMRGALAVVVKTIEARIDRPVTHLPGPAAAGLMDASLAALSEAIDRFDPFKGGRLAAPAGLAVNRVVARWAAGPGASWSNAAGAGAANGTSGGGGGGERGGGGVGSSPVRATARVDPTGVRVRDYAWGWAGVGHGVGSAGSGGGGVTVWQCVVEPAARVLRAAAEGAHSEGARVREAAAMARARFAVAGESVGGGCAPPLEIVSWARSLGVPVYTATRVQRELTRVLIEAARAGSIAGR